MYKMVLPEGHSSSKPRVEVEQNFINAFGPVAVEYDGLEEMLHGDLGAPRTRNPHIVIGERLKWSAGQYNYFTKVIDLHPPRLYKIFGKDGLTQGLLHEGRHMSDFANRPFVYGGLAAAQQTAKLAATYLAVKYAVEIAPAGIQGNVFAGSLAGFYTFNKANTLIYKNSLSEERARQAAANTELIQKYAGVITLPETVLSLTNDLSRISPRLQEVMAAGPFNI